MPQTLRRAAEFAGLYLFVCGLVVAQDWKTNSSLPGVDLTGLNASQKATVLKILRGQGCSCGCSMKMAQCRVEDPSCSYSTGLAATVVESIKSGKTEAEAIAAAGASRWAHNQDQGRVLDEAVKIPIAGSPYTGPGDAPITIIEFSDFQCPYCILAVPQIDAVLRNYPKQVKLIFKEFPLEIHNDAYRAAAAALAAHKQGKFWAMHNALFAHHNDLSLPMILEIAKENGLDIERLQRDMDSKEIKTTIETDVQDGEKAGVEGTPTIFINGQRYNGRIELTSLKPLLDTELKKTITQTASR